MSLREEFLHYCSDAALPAVKAMSGGEEILVTRGELLELAAGAAGLLARQGVARGDKVLLSLQNEIAFPQWFWGAQLLGAAAVPIEPVVSQRRKPSQLEHLHRLVSLIRPKVLVLSSNSIVLDDDVPAVRCLRTGKGAVTSSAVPNVQIEPGDCAQIQLSSGSTGHPKGCVLSQRAVCANARAWLETFDYRPGETTFNWMPLFHDFGLMVGVIAPVFGRMASILLPVESFVSSPATWLRRMSGIGPVHTAGPSSALALLRSRLASRTSQSFALQDVRSLVCAAEPIYPGVVEEFIEAARLFGFRAEAFYAAYGMSETTVLACGRRGLVVEHVHCDGPDVGARLIEGISCGHSSAFVRLGRAVRGAEFRIVDDARNPLPERHIGHLHIRSPCLMDGYLDAPEQTRAVLSDGWYSTGDIGFLANGEFHFVTRSKDLIVVAGRKIAPADIDNAVSEKLAVPASRVASFGYLNHLATESIAVVIETRLDDTEALRRAASMACFERTGITPASVVAVTIGAIPKTTSGKVKRAALRLWLARSTTSELQDELA